MSVSATDAAAAPGPDALLLPRRRAWSVLWALSLAQLVSWGTLYYAFSLFLVPMERDLGWSRTELTGALSLGLMVAGLAAMPVGMWLDRHGGRLLMTAGSLLGGVLLLLWSRSDSLVGFYAIWIGMGLAMSATLYDPAFAVVTAIFGAEQRRAITALTLVGGLASTAFIPLTQLFIAWFGWRDALVGLSLFLLLPCVLIHLLALKGVSPRPREASANGPAANGAPLGRALRRRAFWGLAVCFASYSIAFSAMTFHLIPMLTERGIDDATIVACIAMIGPMQVAGRLALMAFARRIDARRAGAFVVLALPLSIVWLALAPTNLVTLTLFAVLYGTANGIMTIVRGTAVPELIGRDGYGAINGALAFPAMVCKSAAPVAAALIWQAGGYGTVLACVIALSTVAALSFAVAALDRRGPA